MFQAKVKSEGLKQRSISLTAYRTLVVLAELLKHPLTKEQLINLLSDGIDGENISNDTLKRTLNTLKKSGCVISRPTEKNGRKYTLISHPFLPEFQKADFLNTIRKNLALTDDYENLNKVNKLYDKLMSVCSNEDLREKIKTENPFNSVNSDILDKFISGNLWQKVVEFDYFSANSGLQKMKFIPERMSMKNSKLYIWGYCFKYNQYAFLNLERIKEIDKIYEIDKDLTLPAYEITYTLTGDSVKSFVLEENEEIIEKSAKELKIRLLVSDEFAMFQRLLPFGTDLKSISPEYVRELFIEKLRTIRKRYFE